MYRQKINIHFVQADKHSGSEKKVTAKRDVFEYRLLFSQPTATADPPPLTFLPFQSSPGEICVMRFQPRCLQGTLVYQVGRIVSMSKSARSIQQGWTNAWLVAGYFGNNSRENSAHRNEYYIAWLVH